MALLMGSMGPFERLFAGWVGIMECAALMESLISIRMLPNFPRLDNSFSCKQSHQNSGTPVPICYPSNFPQEPYHQCSEGFS